MMKHRHYIRIFPFIVITVLCLALVVAFIGSPPKEQEQEPQWLQELRDSLSSKDQWERVVALRHFAHKTADVGTTAFYMDFATVDSMPVETLYEAFRHDMGSVYCGGMSLYLQKLYNKFGYRSWSYDMGEVYKGKGGASHQFNLVEIPLEDDTILSPQDAYFGQTYFDQSGNPLDFFRLLALLNKKQADSVIIQPHGNAVYVDYLMGLRDELIQHFEDSAQMQLFKSTIQYRKLKSNHPAGFSKIQFEQSLDLFMHMSGEKYRRFLQNNGYPPNFLYLFLFPKAVNGPEDVKMLAKIDSIIASKTP